MEGRAECGGGGAGGCACSGSLAVLADVQRAYEDRLQVIEKVGGAKKLQMQVEALQAWVRDLVEQNTLLARAVSELEHEATARLALERTRHAEIEVELRAEAAALRRRAARKEADVRGLVEVLRRLRESDCSLDGIHFFDVTESDIFGSNDLWRQEKQDRVKSSQHAQGDFERSRKSSSARSRSVQRRRFYQ